MEESARPIESDAKQAPSGADAPPTDGETKALIKTLLKEYPRLDQMQAETLVWAYKTNNLGLLEEE